MSYFGSPNRGRPGWPGLAADGWPRQSLVLCELIRAADRPVKHRRKKRKKTTTNQNRLDGKETRVDQDRESAGLCSFRVQPQGPQAQAHPPPIPSFPARRDAGRKAQREYKEPAKPPSRSRSDSFIPHRLTTSLPRRGFPWCRHWWRVLLVLPKVALSSWPQHPAQPRGGARDGEDQRMP